MCAFARACSRVRSPSLSLSLRQRKQLYSELCKAIMPVDLPLLFRRVEQEGDQEEAPPEIDSPEMFNMKQ